MLNYSQEVIKIADSSVTQAKMRRRGPSVFYLFIAIGLVVAIGLSFGLNVLVPRMQRDAPERLGNLQLVGSVEGAEALAQTSRLHGTDIELASAYIVEYVHGTERGTVWVGRAESRDAAAELTRRMVNAIEMGGSGFSNLRRLTIAGHEVFRVDGPGGEHFFYNSRRADKQVVWLTIEADDPFPILTEAVKIF